MPRKRPPESASPAPASAPRHRPSAPAIPLVVFCVAVIIELLLYYGLLTSAGVPVVHLQQRLQSLNFLAAPDQLILLWCGGKLEFFSLLDRWPLVLLTALILATAWMAGRLLLLALGVWNLLDRLEQSAFALGAGLNLLSLYALAVGLAGGLQQRWLFIIPILVLANANVCTRTPAGTKPSPGALPILNPSPFPYANDSRWLWALLIALPFAIVIFFGAMLPPWDYDVREYHLQSPKEWFQNGRIDFLPHNIYANMPLGSELTGLWAMSLAGGTDGWWWGAITGKTVMACYSLVAAAALVAFGRRLHSLAAGVVAAVIYLCVPWTVSLATAGYNEGPVSLYAVLAIFGLWLSNNQQVHSNATRLTLLAGFCAGSAVACKYPPLLFVVIPFGFFVAWRSFREGEAPAEPPRDQSARLSRSFALPLLTTTVFAAAALAACGLWFAKNWVQTNNPTYPLLYSAFDGRTRTPEKDAQWKKVHSPQPDASGRRFSASNFASQLAWNGWRTLWASLAIPPLAAMALLDRKYWRFIGGVAAWMLYVFTLWWFYTHRLDRFLVLLLPLAALVSAIGVFAVPHPAWRAATLGFIVCAAIAQFPFVTLHPDNRFFAPLNSLRRDDRDLSMQGLRVEAAHRWLNEHGKPGEKALLLGDAEPFDIEIPTVYNTCFDDCQFTRLFKDQTRDERLAALRDEKIAYVFCSWIHLARYRSPGNYGYTSDYPTPELVHEELVRDQKLLIPIPLESDPLHGELFRVADQ